MSIILIFNNKDTAPWAKKIRELFPSKEVEVYPHVKDKSKINYALCWKPTKGILSEFPNLKFIQSTGAAIDHITNTQTISEGVLLSRMVDHRLTTDMFEFTLTATLNYLKNLTDYQNKSKQVIWEPLAYKSMPDITVAILGLGKIGSYVASQFSQLGCKVRGWSRSEKQIKNVDTYHGLQGLRSTLIKADVLVNILPVTSETENILNKVNLSLLNKNSCLINIGRGEHLVEQDLLELFESNHINQAFLDVFREEPLPKDHPFWNHDKIVITPHIAAITNLNTASLVAAENIKRFEQGKKPLFLVSLEKGY